MADTANIDLLLKELTPDSLAYRLIAAFRGVATVDAERTAREILLAQRKENEMEAADGTPPTT